MSNAFTYVLFLTDFTLTSLQLIRNSYEQVGNFAAELFNQQGHLGASVSNHHKGLMYKPSHRVEAACASGGIACTEAIRSIRGALNDVVLAIGVEKQTDVKPRTGGKYLGRAADYQRQKHVDDFLFPALFARRVKAYLEKYPHVSMKDISKVVAKAYANAKRNPKAHMYSRRHEMTLEKANSSPVFLRNQDLRPYLRVADCSQVSDGAASSLFMSERAMRRLGIPASRAVEIIDTDQGVGNIYKDPQDLTELRVVREVVRRMLRKHRIDVHDVDVFELHDCFAIAEVLMYEAIGLARPGRGVGFVERASIGGDCPVNTGGGLLAFGHPVGATGVKQLIEIFRQMKGKCDSYQIRSRSHSLPHLGLAVNMGGDDKTVVATLLRNVISTAPSKL